jgi:hypothetical protein
LAARDRAEREGVDHRPRLEASLDLEKATDLAQHCHSLTIERVDGGFEPFISYQARLKSA